MRGAVFQAIRVGIVGDYDPTRVSHPATEQALEHAANAVRVSVEANWLATTSLVECAAETVGRFDALFCAPGDYESLDGAVEATRAARESGTPFVGTCNGFQHTVIEFARNVLGFPEAQHAEGDPGASNLFIRPLSCSLVGKKMRVEIRPGSTAHSFYGKTEAEEVYRCDFGLDPGRQELIVGGSLRVSGADQAGEARILELPDYPFFVATLFVPQLSSSAGEPHPLIFAFLEAALGRAGEEQTGTKPRKAPAQFTSPSG